jgi:hypothetical protein
MEGDGVNSTTTGVDGTGGAGGAGTSNSTSADGAGGASTSTVTGAGGTGGFSTSTSTGVGGAGGTITSTPTDSGGAGGTSGSSTSTSTVEDPCPVGVTCVTAFPFHDERDTSQEGPSSLDHYSCAAATDESGPEIVYRVALPAAGFLSAAVYDGAGVDIDVHILSELDATKCLDRNDVHVRADVPAGYAWVIADTYAKSGVPQSGSYSIDIGFIEPSSGPCAMEVGTMARVNDGGNHLAMPATGPMVKEAHLVTQAEPPPYPMTATEELAEHYALSQSKTGLVMSRKEVWAPLEGGSHYGAGIGSPTAFPVMDEGWYVNMYWTSAARPPKGTKMIVRDPNGGSRAVVVSAGYETGPGDLTSIGGTPEETHFYMKTSHLSEMKLGIAVDQSIPLGPRVCQ